MPPEIPIPDQAEAANVATETERQEISSDITSYVTDKTSNAEVQIGIYERATEFAKESADLGKQLNDGFDTLGIRQVENETDVETVKKEFITKLTRKTTEHLKGQESKIVNATEFIQQVTTFAIDSVKAEKANLSPEAFATKINDALALVSMAVEAISFQDLAANSVTIGDHGWHHLYQDMRDSLALAEGLSDTELSANDKLLLALTAAFHDIGYASKQVNGQQKASSKNYNVDIGHPVLGYVFLKNNAEVFKKVLSEEEFDGFLQMVINHENPERAARAGEKYEKMCKAFAHADAGASVGKDKVPPIIGQVPAVMEYYYTLNQAKVHLESKAITQEQYDVLVGSAKQKVESILQSGDFNPEQAQQLLNVFTDSHIGKNSLNFVLGRLAGEMGPPKVVTTEKEQKLIALEMNLGEAQTIEKYLPGAKDAGAKLAAKVFGEQAGIQWPKDAQGKTPELAQLLAFLISSEGKADGAQPEQNLTLQVGEIQVRATKGANDSVELNTDTIRLTYNPKKQAKGQREFYDRIILALDESNKKLTQAVNETSKNK